MKFDQLIQAQQQDNANGNQQALQAFVDSSGLSMPTLQSIIAAGNDDNRAWLRIAKAKADPTKLAAAAQNDSTFTTLKLEDTIVGIIGMSNGKPFVQEAFITMQDLQDDFDGTLDKIAEVRAAVGSFDSVGNGTSRSVNFLEPVSATKGGEVVTNGKRSYPFGSRFELITGVIVPCNGSLFSLGKESVATKCKAGRVTPSKGNQAFDGDVLKTQLRQRGLVINFPNSMEPTGDFNKVQPIIFGIDSCSQPDQKLADKYFDKTVTASAAIEGVANTARYSA